MRVERVEESAVFRFTWQIYGLPEDDPRRTHVEFTLEPAGAGTRLTVVETWFAQPSVAERQLRTWPLICRSAGRPSPSTWPCWQKPALAKNPGEPADHGGDDEGQAAERGAARARTRCWNNKKDRKRR
jgi:activator of Hsp90 ATPase-like protein